MFKFMWNALKTVATLFIGAAAGAAGTIAILFLIDDNSYARVDNEIKEQRRNIQESLNRA